MQCISKGGGLERRTRRCAYGCGPGVRRNGCRTARARSCRGETRASAREASGPQPVSRTWRAAGRDTFSDVEKLYDQEYVAQHGFGFDQFAASIAGYTPEWAYPETGIDPSTIRETAREMARHKPATLVHPGRHATWYGDDAQRSRAMALLNALLGSWGRKGGFYTPASMDIPAYPYPPYPTSPKGKADNRGVYLKFGYAW